MASGGLLQLLAAGPQVNIADRYNQGVKEGYSLADVLGQQDARQHIGPALQRDKGALAQLLLGDPQMGLEVQKILTKEDGNGNEFGLNMIWGTDPDGNTVAFQANKGGGVRPVQFPKGVKPTPGMSFQDMGTYVLPVNSKSGVPGAPMPKDVAGAETQKAYGKGLGEAQTNLPQIESSANMMLGSIDSLLNDPYLPNMVGPVNSRLPNLSGDAARVQSKIDQIQGQSFLQAFNQLRGGGQITEVEGQKATAAINRLNAAQNIEDYRAALGELRDIVNGAVTRARRQAGGAPQEALPSGNIMSSDPQVGQAVNGYKIGATARNPQTGQTIVWDGNGWRPQ